MMNSYDTTMTSFNSKFEYFQSNTELHVPPSPSSAQKLRFYYIFTFQEENRKAFIENTLKPQLPYFGKILAANNSGKDFFVGSKGQFSTRVNWILP